MRKLLIMLSLAVGLFGADAANDLLLSQRKPDNSGNIQRNVPAQNAITSGSLSSFQSSIGLGTEDSPTFTGLTLTNFPTFSAGTATRVPFFSTAGLLADSASLTYNSGTGALTATSFNGTIVGGAISGTTGTFTGLGTFDGGTGGLPTVASGSVLRVAAADSAIPLISGDAFGSVGIYLTGRAASGTRASPTATADGLTLLALAGQGFENSAYSNNARYQMIADGLWSGSNHGAYHQWDGTSNGSTSRTLWMTLRNTVLTVASLGGTGSRAVLADANGALSAPVSDERVKEPLRPLPESYGLPTVLRLQPSIFKYLDKKKYGSQDYIGFGARYTATVLPEVTGQDVNGAYYLNKEDLTAVLVKAMQQQQAQIDRGSPDWIARGLGALALLVGALAYRRAKNG